MIGLCLGSHLKVKVEGAMYVFVNKAVNMNQSVPLRLMTQPKHINALQK